MTAAIEHLEVIHNNPFIFSTALTEFYSELGAIKNNILLAYLVLPLVLPEHIRDYLQSVRSSSSLRTMRQERSRIHGLASRVCQHRSMTDKTLQYLLDMNIIKINPDMAIAISGKSCAAVGPIGTDVAARGLAKLCRPYDVQTVYRMLGVRSL